MGGEVFPIPKTIVILNIASLVLILLIHSYYYYSSFTICFFLLIILSTAPHPAPLPNEKPRLQLLRWGQEIISFSLGFNSENENFPTQSWASRPEQASR